MTYDDAEPSAASAGSVGMANLATVNLFHAEIARLDGVNDRLRAEIERLRAMAFNPVTLTDAEREALETAVRMAGDPSPITAPQVFEYAATLRGLLQRLR